MELTNEQKEAVNELDNNLQIIACAGSGKTEVITRRISNILKIKPDVVADEIVAFTFTEKAAEEMKKRITKEVNNKVSTNGMYIGTIHGFCYKLLNEYTDEFKDFKILDTVKNHLFVERYFDKCGMLKLNLDLCPRNINLFLSCIEKMIDDYENREKWSDIQREVLEDYIECLYSHKYLDFSMLIFEAIRQIKNNTNVSDYIKRIKYLVVDEYQDIDDVQEKLIQYFAQFGANICVVGDDDQTIYQFRGSNANNMITFSKRYKKVHQVKLEINFRCNAGIVDIADKVIQHNSNRIIKQMRSDIDAQNSEIKAIRFEDKNEQYNWIAKKIKYLHDKGHAYSDIAILIRKGKYINPIIKALDDESIPSFTDSADHFFNGSYFNRFAETLRILTEIDKAKLYDCWKDIIDDNKFKNGFKFLRSAARGGKDKLSEILNGYCEKVEFLNEESEDLVRRKIDLDGICKVLNDYDEIYGDWQLSARIKGVLKFLGTRAADEYKYYNFEPVDINRDAVQVMTVHKSKGLEFSTVFLPELEKREFPVSNMGGKKYWHVLKGTFEENKDKYSSDIEDERKLFYVATTRAKENLFFTYELSEQPISEFVKESAVSDFLTIDKNDLNYKPSINLNGDFYHVENINFESNEEEVCNCSENQYIKKEYWEAVKYAKNQLYDYYGTACHYFPAAHADLLALKSMSPEEILRLASQYGLI